MGKAFKARLSCAIESKLQNALSEPAAQQIGNVIGCDSAERTGDHYADQTVVAEKSAVCQNSGQQQGNVPFDH
jgi:hypothetical protein